MRSISYPLTRKLDESWNNNNAKRFEYQRTNDHNQRYSQEWMKNNFLLNVNKVDHCIEDGSHMASHV